MKKKKYTLIFITIIFILILSLNLFACDNNSKQYTNNSSSKQYTFGYFSYNGKYLYRFADGNSITANEAKKIINSSYESSSLALAEELQNNSNIDENHEYQMPSLSKELINTIITNYAGLEINTKYYIDGIDEQQVKLDYTTGTDFKNYLEENKIVPFSQLVAQNLVITEDIIDYMELMNEDFKNSDFAAIAPFKNIFTYYKDISGRLVVQMSDFAEIPSSEGGGIGCSYRQDTEILYDSENKISKWQTSLGVYTSTPTGTMKQGYILEIEFKWDEKV